MRDLVIALGLAVVCATGCSRTLEKESSPVSQADKTTDTCNAPEGIMCMAKDVAASDSGLDHIDTLGYSGAAFRIHTLPREVLCPSTVSARFGYIPPTVDQRSRDTVTALRRAEQLAKGGQFGEYISGTTAYDLWIKLLEAGDETEFMQQQMKVHAVEDAGLPTLNTYCYLALVHARESAGPFLRRGATELNGDTSRRVEEAAICYEKVAAALKTIGRPSWAPEAREKQAAALRKARDYEIKAAALLGDALAGLGETGSPGTP